MRTLSGLLVLVVLLLAGCGTGTTPTGTWPDSDVVGTGKTADLDFTATTLEGESFDGANLKGKPTVMWLWTPWCPTCRAQVPTVSGIGEEYAERVNVVAVGGLDSQEEIEAMADKIDHVTHLVHDEGEVWQDFRVAEQSSYTVIAADGEIIHEGYLDNSELEDLVADLAG